jgi:hypothetical protein
MVDIDDAIERAVRGARDYTDVWLQDPDWSAGIPKVAR